MVSCLNDLSLNKLFDEEILSCYRHRDVAKDAALRVC